MQKKGEPEPRFSQFTEVFNGDGKLIGFSIPDCDFIFKYDSHGGWYDEERNYYNTDGVLQSDDEDIDDLESDNEDLSDIDDDQLVDQFQDLLRKEEEGYVRKETKKVPKVEQEQKVSSQNKTESQPQLVKFQDLIDKYQQKQHLKENLPGELFIYFKQQEKQFQKIKYQVQKFQSLADKNKHIESKIKEIEIHKKTLIATDKWLGQPQVTLDFSGESEIQNEYERYWYGNIKTTPQRYIYFLKQIKKSQKFYLLENKTYYALKSKFYHKKSQEDIKKAVKEFTSKVEALTEKQSIVIRIDNLPENFPLSTVYDLIEFVNGNPSQVQQAIAIDEQSAQLTVLKGTALKLINLEAYTHDKGQFLEVSLKQTKDRVEGALFYHVSIDGKFKFHERQLNDTLALTYSKSQLAKHFTSEQQSKTKIRLAIGSISALKKVLMFRGQSLNAIHVKYSK